MKYKLLLTIIIIILLPGNVYANATYNPAKGLAMASANMEDLTSLGIAWWYTWGENCTPTSAPGCINMVRSMQLPAACYDVLLVGNEPNAKEPWGAPITPTEAARKVRAIQLQCPTTKLIVGNVSADDWSNYGGWGSGYNWLRKFKSEYKRLYRSNYTGGIGVHCYQTQSGWCITQLKAMRSLYTGEMSLTEYNDLSGNISNFIALTDYAFLNFTRVGLYTNRQPAAPWALNGASVVRNDGTLDDRGVYYSQR